MSEFRNGPGEIAATGPGAAPSTSAESQGPRQYKGPRDVGKAESLYQSALTKKDLAYALQLLFMGLLANPEHAGIFDEILARIPTLAAHKKGIRVTDLLTRGPADAFVSALAVYCGTPTPERAMDCAAEALKVDLVQPATVLGQRVLKSLEQGEVTLKAPALTRLMDILEASDALEEAVQAAKFAVRLFPEDQTLRQREKNLLASQYLKERKVTPSSTYRSNLQHPEEQMARHRPTDQNARVDELEQQYRHSHTLEDFRELVRAVRESPAARREAALEVLRDGLARFGEKDILWFTREIELDRRWAEVRARGQLVTEGPEGQEQRRQYDALRQEVLKAHIDHLYEVASSLPPGPDRLKRELDLAQRLFEAGRYEEAIKQAQSVKRRPERRLDAWAIMAKSFVQLGLTPEASACFQNVLAELGNTSHGSGEQILEAKYSYAELLVSEARGKNEPMLAQQARKLCSEVMLDDIDYREIRKLSAEAETLARQAN